MGSEIEPTSDDVAITRALHADRPASRCACCNLPTQQPLCAPCMNHAETDPRDPGALTKREMDHQRRWMQALAIARRHSREDKEKVAAALRSRDMYRDALRQLWHLHAPKPSAATPQQCGCGVRWPCRTSQLVERVVGRWAADQERVEQLREEHLDREYQRSLNPPPSDLRPFRPRRR